MRRVLLVAQSLLECPGTDTQGRHSSWMISGYDATLVIAVVYAIVFVVHRATDKHVSHD